MLLVRHYLRYAICLLLVAERGPLRVAEIAAALQAQDYRLRGRPTQAVSDVLRTEVRAGRALKLDHGLYVAGIVSRSHLRYARRCLIELARRPAIAATPTRR
jgi:hypothetical protein